MKKNNFPNPPNQHQQGHHNTSESHQFPMIFMAISMALVDLLIQLIIDLR